MHAVTPAPAVRALCQLLLALLEERGFQQGKDNVGITLTISGDLVQRLWFSYIRVRLKLPSSFFSLGRSANARSSAWVGCPCSPPGSSSVLIDQYSSCHRQPILLLGALAADLLGLIGIFPLFWYHIESASSSRRDVLLFFFSAASSSDQLCCCWCTRSSPAPFDWSCLLLAAHLTGPGCVLRCTGGSSAGARGVDALWG
jgi:hypothetical protein